MQNNEHITLKIEGMDCNNCALGITRTIEKRGLKNVNVNFATGEATFDLPKHKPLAEVINDITKLGYKVLEESNQQDIKKWSSIEKKFIFCLIFTVPLFLHMFLPFSFLQNPIVQLFLCIPVCAVGLHHFGRSAYGSIKAGVPNMDVLIFIGSISAFIYSLAGTFFSANLHEAHHYLFYETAATIITLVLLGNVMEHRSVKQTTTAIAELSKLKKTTAKKINGNNNIITEVDADSLVKGDYILVNMGDKIAADGIIISGELQVDESMITGESLPISKFVNDFVTAGTIVLEGNAKYTAERTGNQTTLAQIINLVKNAQNSKPSIQKLGDKIAAVFVPIVLAIAAITFVISHFIFQISSQTALMNSIAVLVISCPCAMGLATPTAIIAGIGRAAKNGILVKGGNTLEEFAKIKNIIFDKTGTITTGEFKIDSFKVESGFNEKEIREIIYAAELNSSHPIAKSLVKNLKHDSNSNVVLNNLNEIKNVGLAFSDGLGNNWKIGSHKLANMSTTADLIVLKNDELAATLTIKDELKKDIKEHVEYFTQNGVSTYLISGDKKNKCEMAALHSGIKNVMAEKSPEEKMVLLKQISKSRKTAMFGDGINDAPALAKADVGISIANATDVAIQQSQIILLNKTELSQLVLAHKISVHTLLTIKQNLFWAFFYNIIAIPIAALGFLNPMIGALAMAFSDVIVIGNSIRLKTKNLN